MLEADEKRWIETEMALERRTLGVWYNVPAPILAQLVWKVWKSTMYYFLWYLVTYMYNCDNFFTQEEFNKAIKKAITGLEQTMTTYESSKRKVIKQIESSFRDRAYKVLAVANPANGASFLQLIYNYNWNQKGSLAKDKVVVLGQSHLPAER